MENGEQVALSLWQLLCNEASGDSAQESIVPSQPEAELAIGENREIIEELTRLAAAGSS